MIARALLLLIIAAVVAAIFMVMPVRSHSWYSDQFVPASAAPDWYKGQGCCFGEGEYRDCNHAPEGSVREMDIGYMVVLTKAQMLDIRPGLKNSKAWKALPERGIEEFVLKSEARPAMDGGYSLCLRDTPWQPEHTDLLFWIICFFEPTNT